MGAIPIFDQGFLIFATKILVFFLRMEISMLSPWNKSPLKDPGERARYRGTGLMGIRTWSGEKKNGQPDTRCQFRNSPSLKYILFTVPPPLPETFFQKKKSLCKHESAHIFFYPFNYTSTRILILCKTLNCCKITMWVFLSIYLYNQIGRSRSWLGLSKPF